MSYKNFNERVRESENEAERFLQRIKEWRDANKTLDRPPSSATGTKESGAIRRASLDLSRSLSALRRG